MWEGSPTTHQIRHPTKPRSTDTDLPKQHWEKAGSNPQKRLTISGFEKPLIFRLDTVNTVGENGLYSCYTKLCIDDCLSTLAFMIPCVCAFGGRRVAACVEL